jgi:ribose transport system permease protein
VNIDNKKKNSFLSLLKRWSKNPNFPSVIVLIVLLVINVVLQPNFFSLYSIKSNFKTFVPLIMVSMAQAIIMISGSVDLSIGAILSMGVVAAASIMTDSLVNVILVVLLMILVTVGASSVNGVIIGKFKFNPLISTYATQAVFFGIAMYIMPVPGGYVPRDFYKIYSKVVFGFIPMPIIILLIALIVWFLISKTRIYRHIYAVGSNEEAAYASGINVSKVRFIAHLIAGIFIGFASLCLLMVFASGDPRAGLGYTMNSIAAVVIGGVALTGGKGSVLGAVIGALVLGLLINIIFYANLSSLYQGFAKGMIIVIALAVASIPKIREEKHQIH